MVILGKSTGLGNKLFSSLDEPLGFGKYPRHSLSWLGCGDNAQKAYIVWLWKQNILVFRRDDVRKDFVALAKKCEDDMEREGYKPYTETYRKD